MAGTSGTGSILDEALRDRAGIWAKLRSAERRPIGRAAAVNAGLPRSTGS